MTAAACKAICADNSFFSLFVRYFAGYWFYAQKQ